MFEIVASPIDLQRVYDRVRDDAFGAIVVFAGVVRRRSDDDRDVCGLSYEAYDTAALAEMEKIAAEVRARWSPCRIAITHRTGELKIGEPSVAVGVGTPHRAEAFAACEYAMNELKARVPVWKKEHYLDGTSEWRQNCAHEASS
jgi:molybdopterin synthase catalytic subunit